MIAARVAAQLKDEPGVTVQRRRGGLGELRVTVDGAPVVETSRLLYPTPASVVERVRVYLKGHPPHA